MPQLVRDWRYCSHCEQGVEMGESMSLLGLRQHWCAEKKEGTRGGGGASGRVKERRGRKGAEVAVTHQWPPFTLW